ncbi:hypothetical protein SPRG_20654 [Saprolegnia parasitica CBS 223.65]|uniref:Uncharacterized protein n=1 Tax=Saprolegnia parasitica (strain CBS 223.65) TaxID=695850 RepID=A0A067C4T2_SAPPC|nr:hypothetical protein SPRG_20654 [Saprolegnia parasitica CBS 223.65]KDO25533.1 hypothetical protein SPRG_20654 [Saprolegnia parasitica CBS 223.65]|eukprot:XP_012203763.1 hypothetical protein SPRG_20654 [Saprolegnia parasitica CBS 223.65]
MPQLVLRPYTKNRSCNPLEHAEEWRVMVANGGAITDDRFTQEMLQQRMSELNTQFEAYSKRIYKRIFLFVHLPMLLLLTCLIGSCIVLIALGSNQSALDRRMYGSVFGRVFPYIAIAVTVFRNIQSGFIETVNYMNVRDEVYEVRWSYVMAQNTSYFSRDASQFGAILITRGPPPPQPPVQIVYTCMY